MLKRSITGLSLGLVMISGLLFSQWSASLLLIIILVFSSLEWNKHFNTSKGTTASTLFFLFISAFVLIIIAGLINQEFTVPPQQLSILNLIIIFILALFGFDLIAKKDWPFCRSWYAGIFYIGFPLLLACFYLLEDFETHRYVILGLIIINWSNDVFAYFIGRLIGKHPLAPEISPKKTIEGALGGLLAAIISAFLVNHFLFIEPYTLITILFLGISIWFAGTLGDLYESKMKRIAGIKDSGTLLPGHGGFLDRFDSFFFIIPIGIFVLSF